jgi:hypothetical protein
MERDEKVFLKKLLNQILPEAILREEYFYVKVPLEPSSLLLRIE